MLFLLMCGDYGGRWTVLPALWEEGVLHVDIKPGGYNGDEFMGFVEDLLEHMLPYPNERSVLFWDNCPIHHVDGIQEMCDTAYVNIYLPCYVVDHKLQRCKITLSAPIFT